MIEHMPNVKFIADRAGGQPVLLWQERAVLACGCMCVVGRRADNGEQATAAAPCSAEHEPMMREFHDLFRASLAEPMDRPAVDVADMLLEEAHRRHAQ